MSNSAAVARAPKGAYAGNEGLAEKIKGRALIVVVEQSG